MAGWAPAKITPPIFLLQELRDKRDLQDLPAIQIEYLILAAGEERGLAPGHMEVCGQWAPGMPASRAGVSSSQGKRAGNHDTMPGLSLGARGDRQPHTGGTEHSLPNLPLIPPAARQLRGTASAAMWELPWDRPG